MNKNYYEILQINQNASPEIIDKAYKTLAKKYHPDLQEESDKKQAEEILKEINEAYEILSNPDKKALYDQNLKNEAISQEDYDEIYEENQNLKKAINNMRNLNYNNYNKNNNNNLNNNYSNINNNIAPNAYYNQKTNQEYEKMKKAQELEYQRQLEQARQKAYHDAYIQDLKNRGYRIKYKKSLKDYIRGIITIILVIIILFGIFQIPFVQNFFINIYEENEILNNIVNFFINLFK